MSRAVGEDDDIASDQVVWLGLPVEGQVGLAGKYEVELGHGVVVDPKAPRCGEFRAAKDDAADVDGSKRIGEVVGRWTDSAHAYSVGPPNDRTCLLSAWTFSA